MRHGSVRRLEQHVGNAATLGAWQPGSNERIGRIKMMFRWAAEMMIVPAAVFHTLATVPDSAAGEFTQALRHPSLCLARLGPLMPGHASIPFHWRAA